MIFAFLKYEIAFIWKSFHYLVCFFPVQNLISIGQLKYCYIYIIFILFQSGRYIALADYCAVGISEVNMKDGDIVELLKVGCAGWWFVKVIGKFYAEVHTENLN